MKPCIDFIIGNCRRGECCGFLHQKPLSRAELIEYCQTTFTSTYSPDPERRQSVIVEMSTEHGLTRVQQLVNLDYNKLSAVNAVDAVKFFSKTSFPFVRSITHQAVLTSFLLKVPRNNIYSFVCGVEGLQAVIFFGNLVHILSKLVSFGTQSYEAVILSMASILTALRETMDCNQTADMPGDFRAFTNVIAAEFNKLPVQVQRTPSGQVINRQLISIRRRLDFGFGTRRVAEHESVFKESLTTFEKGIDWPGTLSANGPRHDNDHASISCISIMPTDGEIRSGRREYLPLTNQQKFHRKGPIGVLDRNFRLLREDTVGLLRDCVSDVLKSLTQPRNAIASNEGSRRSIRYLVYQSVVLLDVKFEMNSGVQVFTLFDQPNPARELKRLGDRQKWWLESKQ